jgi:hypothetical protein
MDRLKVAVIAGVVVAHVATAYVVDVGWYYEERTTSDLTPAIFGVPVFLGAVFGLAPLFLLGGVLAARSLRRRGPVAFARARLLRLGLPALAFFLLVDPLADYLGGRVQGETRSLGSYLTDLGGDHDLGPVWFITALLAFSLAYAAWRRWRPTAPDAHPQLQGGATAGDTPWRSATLAGAAVAIAAADLLTWQWWPYFSETLWNLNWQHWPQAAGLFALGVVVGERGGNPSVPAAVARRWGRLALGALAVFLAMAGYGFASEDPEFIAGLRPGTVAFAVIDGVAAVGVCVWVVSWFERRWDAQAGPVLVRASRGAYAAYLLHPLVLVALSGAMWPLPLAPELKLVLVAAAGVPAVFATGYLATRVPGVSRVL